MPRFTLAVLALALLALPARAADPADPQAAQTKFNQTFGEWKDMLTKMRQIQEKYPSTTADEKKKLESEYDGLIALGRKLAPQLIAAAEQAYAAAPEKDKDVKEFLVTHVRDATRTDFYEEAVRIGKTLIDNGARDPQLLIQVGTAALNVNDYEFARKCAQLGKDASGAGELLSKIDQYEKLWQTEQKIRADEAKADDLPRVKLHTSKGDIVIEMFENEAPNTVANFISLVEKKYYDGVKFHRVLPGFMAQGGDPEGTGSGGPGYTIADELGPGYRRHFRGTLSMAKTAAPDSGGSQFFLTFVRTEHLDGMHTVFGRVIEGLDVVSKLQRIDPGRGGPEPDKIISATVLRKRPHEYKPVVKQG